MSYCIFLSCHGHHNYCYFVPLYILVAAMVAQLEPLPMICGLFSHALPDLNGHPFPFRFRSEYSKNRLHYVSCYKEC